MNENITIVGMPGAGKTSVGKKLSVMSLVPVFDADTEIEIASRMKINDIFEQLGETKFRDGENKIIKRILSNKPVILSAGGGAFINSNTHNIIQQKSISVWLNTEFEIIWKRIANKSHRPILKNKQDMLDIFNYRKKFYKKANIHINCNNKNSTQIAKYILLNINDIKI